MDGQKLTFEGEFDAVFSNAALHWMRDQQAVLAGVRRALKPGGRFVAEMGGHNNTAAIIVALSAVLSRRGLDAHRLSPWYFPSADAYREKLEAAGLRGRGNCDRPAADNSADRDRSLARHLRRGFFRSAAEADRSRRAARWPTVAAGPDGRDRNLDCRLRPAAFSRNPPLDGRPEQRPPG